MPQSVEPEAEGIFSECEWQQLVEDLAFSPREAQIVRCLFDGNSDKQIAPHLKISIPTVRTHLSRLFRKLGVNDREELILHVIKHFRNGCRQINCPRKR